MFMVIFMGLATIMQFVMFGVAVADKNALAALCWLSSSVFALGTTIRYLGDLSKIAC